MDTNQHKNSRFNVCVDSGYLHYVANTLTGAVAEMNELDYQNFITERYDLLGSDAEDLRSQGFIIDRQLDEIRLLRQAYTFNKHSKEYSNITICPTLDCNFRCAYCYENRQPGKMSFETQKKIVHYVRLVLEEGVKSLHVTWYGGEPLLYPDVIKSLSAELIKTCEEFGAKYSAAIITNGYLLSSDIAEMLVRSQVRKAQITIDGDEESHNVRRHLANGSGTYASIVNNIHSLKNLSLKVTVRVNIDRTNVTAFSKVKHAFASMDYVSFYPAIVTKEATQSMQQQIDCFSQMEYNEAFQMINIPKEFLDEFRDSIWEGVSNCTAEHVNSSVIDPWGFIYQCLNDVGNRNIALCSLDDIDNRNALAVSKYFGRDPFTEEECSECPFLPLCYGGCVWQYVDKGEHACPMIKYLYKKISQEIIQQQS